MNQIKELNIMKPEYLNALIISPSEFFFGLFVFVLIYIVFNVGKWFEESVEKDCKHMTRNKQDRNQCQK